MMSEGHRPRVAYVTDLELRAAGGGSYVVNWHAHHQLRRRFDVTYAGPITPTPSRLAVAASRVRRKMLRIPGSFAFFSAATLEDNKRKVSELLRGNEEAIVFRSAARWARCRPDVPYFVYLDAVFHTFFHNTFRPEDFIASDVERIFGEEAEFLEHASGVFFESAWGLECARKAYGLSGSRYYVAGRGGAIDPPPSEVPMPVVRRLLTVAMDFDLKGGRVVLEAYQQLRNEYPDLQWSIVGGAPNIHLPEGVSYEGILDPQSESGARRFRELFSEAWVLVHPTSQDTSPLVITEAAYFGCPAISVNAFAIPELVENGTTGLLIDSPATPRSLAGAIERLILDEALYQQMRRRARQDALAAHSWDVVGSRMSESILGILAQQ